MNTVKTYLQISDLHFCGSVIQQNIVDPLVLNFFPVLKGCVGHNPPTLRYLQRFLKQLKTNEPDVETIVTGDLTACGSLDSFDLAENFLGTCGKRPPFFGLNIPQWKKLAVAGNHDYWPGIPFWPFGNSNSLVRRKFPDWFINPSTQLTDGFSVVFMGLNSDADVKGVSLERLYACGSFESAIDKLDGELNRQRKQSKEIRILLLHHSVAYKGRQINCKPIGANIHLQHLTIDNASRVALNNLIMAHNIKVVLTGHIHMPPCICLLPQLDVLEGCCGTTSQRLTGGSRYPNSIIVHRVSKKQNNEIYWESKAYGLSFTSGGFQPLSNVEGKIRVWP